LVLRQRTCAKSSKKGWTAELILITLLFTCLQPYSFRLHDIIAHTKRTALSGTQTEDITLTHQPHNAHAVNFRCLHRAISLTYHDSRLTISFSCKKCRHTLLVLSLLLLKENNGYRISYNYQYISFLFSRNYSPERNSFYHKKY